MPRSRSPMVRSVCPCVVVPHVDEGADVTKGLAVDLDYAGASASRVVDQASHLNTGTITGPVRTSAPHFVGSANGLAPAQAMPAFFFDGVNDFIQIGPSVSYNMVTSTAYTLEFVSLCIGAGGGGAGKWVEKGGGSGTEGFVLGVASTSGTTVKISGNVRRATTNAVSTTSGSPGSLFKWQHIVATYDSMVDSKMRYFIDGVRVSAAETGGAGAHSDDSATNSRVGNFSTSTVRSFHGYIAATRFYTKALSPEDVRVRYTRVAFDAGASV